MATSLLISGGRVIDPGQRIDKVADLLITKGKVAWIGEKGAAPSHADSKVVDASGLVVCPGFIDLHCHLREPGFEDKETINTGSQAAARGGFTTICCMPNTNPPLDSQSSIDYVKKAAQAVGIVQVLPVGCITKGRQGKELTEMYDLAEAGVVAFSDDGSPVSSSRMMSLAMDYSLGVGLPIIDHCEDTQLTEDACMNEGWVSARLGLKGMPAAAEELMVARDITLAQLSGARLHIAHVSTAGSVELIRRAKEAGLKITAEVTPHHLTLTEERVMSKSDDNERISYDTNAKVNPPLRTRRDIEALVQGLKEGVIDVIATDHAPHTLADKACEFGLAAFGISGFETAFGSLMSLVHEDKLKLEGLISKLTIEPARIIGTRYGELGTLKPGTRADVTIFASNKEWTADSRDFVSKGKNTPFDGSVFKGKIQMTIAAGQVVYKSQ